MYEYTIQLKKIDKSNVKNTITTTITISATNTAAISTTLLRVGNDTNLTTTISFLQT